MLKKLKWLWNRICDGFEQYIEFAILVGAFLVPFRFNVQANVEFDKPSMDVKELLIYYALKHGNVYIGIALVVLIIILFHRINKDRTMNRGNLYHVHTMFWYSLCSWILGYKTCSLVRVPIATQFKLVLKDTFQHYDYGSDDAYTKAEKDKIIIQRCVKDDKGTKAFKIIDQTADTVAQGVDDEVINIAISDTYPIKEDMLPDSCYNSHPTFVIQRESNIKTRVRCYSPNLIHTVNDFVRNLPGVAEIHIYPTTNPKNTFRIVEDVFKTAGRDNIQKLYVHTQPNSSKGDWKFSDKTKRIY